MGLFGLFKENKVPLVLSDMYGIKEVMLMGLDLKVTVEKLLWSERKMFQIEFAQLYNPKRWVQYTPAAAAAKSLLGKIEHAVSVDFENASVIYSIGAEDVLILICLLKAYLGELDVS